MGRLPQCPPRPMAEDGEGKIKAGPLGTTWQQADYALQLGLRAECSTAAAIDSQPDPFLADSHRENTSKWPTASSGAVANAEGETWRESR